ncbi:MAG: LpqN/LpqT family lipoprotein [Mycobacterium sp.]
MKRLTAAIGTGVTVLALSFGLVGCGSDDKSSSSGSASSSATESTEAAGPQKTIADYIAEKKITQIAVKRGDPGPNINVPLPADWQPKQGALPKGTYGAIVFTRSGAPNNPPRVLALLSKLTGDVDPAEILKYAPGELNNLPGYAGQKEGVPSKVSGYDAVQLTGSYLNKDKKGTISQRTVVIPLADAVYVLQLNGISDELETPVLNDAMTFIGDKTTITP